jgi:hypothetical protein
MTRGKKRGREPFLVRPGFSFVVMEISRALAINSMVSLT